MTHINTNHHTNNNLINLNKLVQETAAIVAESNVVNIPSSGKEGKEGKTKVVLHNRQKLKASDAAVVFGGIGLILMVIHNEFIINNYYHMVR